MILKALEAVKLLIRPKRVHKGKKKAVSANCNSFYAFRSMLVHHLLINSGTIVWKFMKILQNFHFGMQVEDG